MKIIAYHGGNLDNGIHEGHLYFTDDIETAKLYGSENNPNYKLYKCELTFENPLELDDEEYDEYMQQMDDWQQPIREGYDSIISTEPECATYYVALDPVKQVKIIKILNESETATLEKEEFIPELNDNFKRWFGDSKVIDDNGQPLVCYHGSTVDIDIFDLGYSGNNTGNNEEKVFYFTSDKDTAITYSQEATVRENEWKFYDEDEKKNIAFEDWDEYADYLREEIFANPKINPCYLRIENPYIYDADYTDFDYKKNYTLISMIKGNSDIDYNYWDESLAEDLYGIFTEYDEETDEYIEKDVSFDGVIIKNVRDNISEYNQDYIDEYIVWNPNQIKSVYNKGIWDMNNPNVNETINESGYDYAT